MKTVAVVGGTGFIGKRLTAHLAKLGYRVRVGCRHPSAVGSVRVAGAVGQVEPIYCNVLAPATLYSLLDGCQFAVNLAGLLYERGSQKFSAVHHHGAHAVASISAELKLSQLVHVSAIGADIDSLSRYASSKGRGEEAVRSAYPEAAILRPSIVFGEGDQFFTRFAKLSQLLPVLPIVGADTKFQPIYVDDLCHAILAILAKTPDGGIYELGGAKVYSFRELMDLMLRHLSRSRPIMPIPFPAAQMLGRLAQLLPVPPLTFDQVLLLESDATVSQNARTLQDLGIRPTPVESVIERCVSHLRDGGQYASIREELLLGDHTA